MEAGKLLVLPCVINDEPLAYVHLPICLKEHLNATTYYIVENLRSARRFIKKINPQIDIETLHFLEINKHDYSASYQHFLEHAGQGYNIGLLSESGTASVGDPGFHVVKQAHAHGIKVHPIAGPSSILQALSASGLNGQAFHFHGYIPIEEFEKIKFLQAVEKNASKATQIFIEAPYRNEKLFETILNTCNANTNLCVASNISNPEEFIYTKSIKEWKTFKKIKLHKIPTIFLLG